MHFSICLMGCLCLSYWFKCFLLSIHSGCSSPSLINICSHYLSFDILVSSENVLENTLSEYFIFYYTLSLSIYLIIKNCLVKYLSLWSWLSFTKLSLRHLLVVLWIVLGKDAISCCFQAHCRLVSWLTMLLSFFSVWSLLLTSSGLPIYRLVIYKSLWAELLLLH